MESTFLTIPVHADFNTQLLTGKAWQMISFSLHNAVGIYSIAPGSLIDIVFLLYLYQILCHQHGCFTAALSLHLSLLYCIVI